MLCGFVDVRVEEERPVVHGIVSAIRWGIWMAFRTIWHIGYAAETGRFEPDKVAASAGMLVSATKASD
jgi:hypothetical protein